MDYSLIVPAYNEEAVLPGTLENLKGAMEAMDGLEGELIVVDNNSSDATAEVARRAGARVVFEAHNQIARARNGGAKAARGEVMVFIDADTRIEAATLRDALDGIRDNRYAAGGARVSFDEEVEDWAKRGLALWDWISRRTQSAAGCFVFCSREAFEATGGFDERVYAGEELYFSEKLRRWGKARGLPFVIVEPAVITSARKLHWFRPWQVMGTALFIVVFPFAVRFRWLCRFWYTRPAG